MAHTSSQHTNQAVMPVIPAGAIELHHRAKHLLDVVPGSVQEHLDSKPSHFIVALERHDNHAWRDEHPKDSFVWIKAKSSVRVSQIQRSYQQQHFDQLSIAVFFGNQELHPATTVGEFDYFNDRLVAFTAVRQGANNRPLAPSPHLKSATTSDSSPSRPPLQPVNRQLTAPAAEADQALEPPVFQGLVGFNPSQKTEQMAAGTDRDFMARPVTHHSTGPAPLRNSAPKIEPATVLKVETSEQSNHLSPPADGTEVERSPTPEYQPREYDNPFLSQSDEQDAPVRGQQLRQLALSNIPERLEAGVKAGGEVLAKLRKPLEELAGNADAQNWLEQIDKVAKEAVKSRTVVGVVGNTGAGKSSVINAMLDEERLVPTNCMRACTAVVTELSYNYSSSENAKYRAEIEFIKPEDWQKELRILFQELIDENGHISRDIANPDSLAGIAYAKIRAVYHKYTKEMLANASVEGLMRVKHVKNVLGTTKKIFEARPEVFYKRLQTYVDSKEKGTEKLNKNGDKITNPTREFEHWPLIKVVKIYTKSDALSTGAVIVDLPGVHDSNAARAAVAEGYMKQCTGLWIVAPINRAVDDKAAKTLLGNTFKRQLKYDGTYSAVTFICSKTDDISRTEAADSLDLGSELSDIEDKLGDLARQRRSLEAELKAKGKEKEDYSDAIFTLDEQIEKWEELKDQLEDGKTVYAPSDLTSKTKKRKRDARSPSSRKKARRSKDAADEDYEDVVAIESDADDANDEMSDATASAPLTEIEIEARLKELQTLKKEARRGKGRFDDQMRDTRHQIEGIEEQEDELNAKQDEMCIAGRNEYSRTAIRQDFAAGIKELDQENAEEEDPDNFDPDKDVRDYDEVERSLPVFCVSSRAYQRLSGRLLKDNTVPGFTTKEQTEIPQLQTHCKKLTEQGRLANCRRFLNNLDQLILSLSLWASDDGTGAKLSDLQRNQEQKFLDRKLKELEKALQTAVIDKLVDISDTLNENLFDKFRPAIAAAAHDAPATANKWGEHRNNGGLHFMTYRATVRRSGIYTGASGFQDFNQQLFDPVQKQLAAGWEKAFHRRLPNILHSFTRTGTDLLRKFHAAIEARCREKGHGVARISLLKTQLPTYQAIFNDIIAAAVTAINEGQRDISREFTPVITACMDPAYQLCSNESGIGSYKRMKAHMAAHVDEQKAAMFNNACEQVRNSLMALVESVRQQMLDRVDEVYVGMRRDYLSVVGGVNVQAVKISREERGVRRDLDEAVSLADMTFQEVVDCEEGELGKVGKGGDGEVDAAVEGEVEDMDIADAVADEGSESEVKDLDEAESGAEYEGDGNVEVGEVSANDSVEDDEL